MNLLFYEAEMFHMLADQKSHGVMLQNKSEGFPGQRCDFFRFIGPESSATRLLKQGDKIIRTELQNVSRSRTVSQDF